MARRETKPGEPRPTYAMRLGEDERRVIAAAAAQAGRPLSAYIRREALRAARRELANGHEAER
jgi:uncharacterized protein (DUF1778 family)